MSGSVFCGAGSPVGGAIFYIDTRAILRQVFSAAAGNERLKAEDHATAFSGADEDDICGVCRRSILAFLTRY
jgi:hypothetical protein